MRFWELADQQISFPGVIKDAHDLHTCATHKAASICIPVQGRLLECHQIRCGPATLRSLPFAKKRFAIRIRIGRHYPVPQAAQNTHATTDAAEGCKWMTEAPAFNPKSARRE